MASQFITEINEKNLKNTNLIKRYIYFLNLIKEYQADNVNTIKKIVTNTEKEPELAEEFKDIAKGLEGEFTRATSIEMAKQKLISHLEGSIDDLIEGYKSIKDYVDNPKEQLKVMLDSVDTNVSIPDVVSRKERYNRTDLERDFMSKKLITLLGTKISNTHVSIPPKEFLFSLREVIAIVKIFEFKNIQEAINVYHNKCVHINENFKNIGKPGQFLGEYDKINVELVDRSGDAEFNKLLSEVKVPDGLPNSELELFDGIVDSLDATLARIKEILEQLSDIFNTLNVSPYNIATTYGPGLKDVLAQYSKTEITNEEFINKLTDAVVILYNANSVEISILNVFANSINILNNYIYIFNYVYGLCEEATVKGTIIDGKINVSLSKKK